MPRKSKTQTTAVVAPGQPYGIAGDQQAAMKTIPLPNTTISGDMSAPTGAIPIPPNELSPTPSEIPSAPQDALMAALNTPPPTSEAFTMPTNRPQEPLMTPVPASEPKRSRAAEILHMLADASGGDPALIQIANDAATKGF